jgi:hypothetical protein
MAHKRKPKQPKLTRRQIAELSPAQIKNLLPGGKLENGSHDFDQKLGTPEGVCLMEAVAWVTGEEHSDQPECACPVLTSAAITFNDRASDYDRQALIPAIPALVGSRVKSARTRFQRSRQAVAYCLSTLELENSVGGLLGDFIDSLLKRVKQASAAGFKTKKGLGEVLQILKIIQEEFAAHVDVDEEVLTLVEVLHSKWDSDGIAEFEYEAIIENAAEYLKDADVSLQAGLLKELGSIVTARR